MAKKNKKKISNNSKILTYIAWGLGIIALVLSSLVSGYYFGYADANEDAKKRDKALYKKRADTHKNLINTNKKANKKSVNNRLKEVLKKESKKEILNKNIKNEVIKNIPAYQVSAAHEYSDLKVDKPQKRALITTTSKPKLAIIIDDMSLSSQVEAIKNLNLNLTMSFMPPRPARPNSAVLAAKENFYMVHLPMEAMSFNKEEPNTLYASDSQQKISKRIRDIKKLFPKVTYINNHTGSRFTSSEIAMNRLIFSLKKNNIQFIDSRTTSKTKVPKVMKNFGLQYIARDVFLDHKMDKKYILGQIKQAIKIAKIHGTAIAIGHPHVNTITALKESKELLKQVELVYINKLY